MTRIMKVTVYFDGVGVLVPCFGQDLTVAGLMELAVARYKKAVGKPSDCLVVVHNLKSASGGILDGDDKVFDVVDDREHVYATYEEEVVRLSRGDGTSASSIGTISPDVTKQIVNLTNDNRMMRQASEPALTKDSSRKARLDDNFEENLSFSQDDTILSIKKYKDSPKIKYGSIEGPHVAVSYLPPLGFSRHLSTRNSIFRGGRIIKNNTEDSTRSDPIGSSAFADTDENFNAIRNKKSKYGFKAVEILNDGESLGIHVVPSCDRFDKSGGLLVHSVDAKGKVGRDGRIREMDKIVEINGKCLSDVDFITAQKVLKKEMNAEKLCLKIIPYSPFSYGNDLFPISAHRAPQITSTPAKDSGQTTPSRKEVIGFFSTTCPRSTSSKAVCTDRISSSTCSKVIHNQQQSNVARLKIKVNAGDDKSLTPLRAFSKGDETPKQVGFTRASAKTTSIQLIKGIHGLGFSITTRDVPTGKNCPIFIKHILPQGAAVKDGRLQAGDKLLRVNGMDLSKRGHDEVVTYLRGIKLGGKVELLVERTSEEGKTTSFNNGQQITYDDRIVEYLIISLEGDIGIGMSVRGKTKQTADGSISDLGLFVKTIHPRGAVARDGRMKVDDRLLEANGLILTGLPNSEAREVLKDAMQLNGPVPQTISFVIERWSDNCAPPLAFQDQNDLAICPSSTNNKEIRCQDFPVVLKRNRSSERKGYALISNETGQSVNRKEMTNDKDDLDFTMVSSNSSPVLAGTSHVFSRGAPERQSMSEKRKNHHDQKFNFYNHIISSRLNGQDHDDTQVTLKRALSAESLISQNNTTVVKTPHTTTKTCGFVREVLRKYTSVENMNDELKTKDKGLIISGNPKDSNGLNEQGKKKIRNIFKGLNIFKTKPKKHVRSDDAANDKKCQSSHRMIDNLLNDVRHQTSPPNRNIKYERPTSACFERDFWTEHGRLQYSENRQIGLQSYLQNTRISNESNYGPHLGNPCHCEAFNYYPAQPFQHRHHMADFSHYRTDSHDYFPTTADPYHGFAHRNDPVHYLRDFQYGYDGKNFELGTQESAGKITNPKVIYFDDAYADDLNDTISTIHQF